MTDNTELILFTFEIGRNHSIISSYFNSNLNFRSRLLTIINKVLGWFQQIGLLSRKANNFAKIAVNSHYMSSNNTDPEVL